MRKLGAKKQNGETRILEFEDKIEELGWLGKDSKKVYIFFFILSE